MERHYEMIVKTRDDEIFHQTAGWFYVFNDVFTSPDCHWDDKKGIGKIKARIDMNRTDDKFLICVGEFTRWIRSDEDSIMWITRVD